MQSSALTLLPTSSPPSPSFALVFRFPLCSLTLVPPSATSALGAVGEGSFLFVPSLTDPSLALPLPLAFAALVSNLSFNRSPRFLTWLGLVLSVFLGKVGLYIFTIFLVLVGQNGSANAFVCSMVKSVSTTVLSNTLPRRHMVIFFCSSKK